MIQVCKNHFNLKVFEVCREKKKIVADFSKCQVHYSRSEMSYKIFYQIPDDTKTENFTLDFHFSVLARSDAHILLSPSDDIQKDDPVYEIVLGAGGNTFADIRRQQKSSVQDTLRIKGLVSALDIHSFYIHIWRGEFFFVFRLIYNQQTLIYYIFIVYLTTVYIVDYIFDYLIIS